MEKGLEGEQEKIYKLEAILEAMMRDGCSVSGGDEIGKKKTKQIV